MPPSESRVRCKPVVMSGRNMAQELPAERSAWNYVGMAGRSPLQDQGIGGDARTCGGALSLGA